MSRVPFTVTDANLNQIFGEDSALIRKEVSICTEPSRLTDFEKAPAAAEWLILFFGMISSGMVGRQEGRWKTTWKREFKLPWREAGPPIHHDDKVDSDR